MPPIPFYYHALRKFAENLKIGIVLLAIQSRLWLFRSADTPSGLLVEFGNRPVSPTGLVATPQWFHWRWPEWREA
jgi:hypothetical protein